VKYFLVLLFSSLLSINAFSQESPQDSLVTVHGHVFTPDGAPLTNLFVVNERLKQGNFGNPNGSFKIKIYPSDKIIIGSYGYQNVTISIEDSIIRKEYYVEVRLSPLSYELNTVTIFGERELNEIYKDIESLGYNKDDYQLNGVNAYASPITALYQAFSRHAQKEQEAIRLMNEAKRREILKELLGKYVDHDIIKLEDGEFDDFLDFCAVTDAQLKGLSQLDFVMYIKKKFQLYRELNPNDYYWDYDHR
tara:strand:+ start:108 stop:854 length:747 start_codon:yes stop_codon:yes gene_type:complete